MFLSPCCIWLSQAFDKSVVDMQKLLAGADAPVDAGADAAADALSGLSTGEKTEA